MARGPVRLPSPDSVVVMKTNAQPHGHSGTDSPGNAAVATGVAAL